MYQSHGYIGMPYDLADSPYRWLIGPVDMQTVYHQHNRGIGVDMSSPDYLNVDSWMDPASSEYNSTLAHAIFHYQAQAACDERFEICIANDDMKDAAWCYGHKSQVMLDGTFGICNKKMLLFILMGVNEKKKGVPLMFLIFSVPRGNQKTCAGYNMEIIRKLLQKWKNSLGICGGESFKPYVAINNTDLMERGALVLVFPRIWLLICKFHLRQCWKNH